MARFEFSVLVVFSVLGMMLMASAGDFITLYLSLELQSLALYVLAAFDRDNLRSTESGMKYFILGALSSGMMLYGISLIYGFGGTIIFREGRHAGARRQCFGRPDFWTGFPDFGSGVQSFGRTVSYVDAGCL